MASLREHTRVRDRSSSRTSAPRCKSPHKMAVLLLLLHSQVRSHTFQQVQTQHRTTSRRQRVTLRLARDTVTPRHSRRSRSGYVRTRAQVPITTQAQVRRLLRRALDPAAGRTPRRPRRITGTTRMRRCLDQDPTLARELLARLRGTLRALRSAQTRSTRTLLTHHRPSTVRRRT